MGVKLARAGCDVSVVARGATLKALQQHGMRLETGGETLAAPVRASASPSDLGAQDVAVIAVKSQAMAEVALCIGPLLGPETIVLTAMNGVPWWFFEGFGGEFAGTRLKAVDPDGTIARAIPARHVVGCVVHASCSVEAPGLVKHHFGNGLIIVGVAALIGGRLYHVIDQWQLYANDPLKIIRLKVRNRGPRHTVQRVLRRETSSP